MHVVGNDTTTGDLHFGQYINRSICSFKGRVSKMTRVCFTSSSSFVVVVGDGGGDGVSASLCVSSSMSRFALIISFVMLLKLIFLPLVLVAQRMPLCMSILRRFDSLDTEGVHLLLLMINLGMLDILLHCYFLRSICWWHTSRDPRHLISVTRLA